MFFQELPQPRLGYAKMRCPQRFPNLFAPTENPRIISPRFMADQIWLPRLGGLNGESPADIAARADRVVTRVREINDNVLIFSSGHFLRVLAAHWLNLEPLAGKYFMLDTASLSALSYEHDLSHPAIQFWNDNRHAVAAD
jgi:broad specificity phosphatase PhoE